VPVNSQHAADPAMVKGKGAEVFGKKDDGQSLVLVGAEGSGGNDVVFPKTEFHAEVVKLGDKFWVGDGQAVNLKWGDFFDNVWFTVFIEHRYSFRSKKMHLNYTAMADNDDQAM
jgi:hypothetical protein